MTARMLSPTMKWVEIISLFRDCFRAGIRRKSVEQVVRTLTQHPTPCEFRSAGRCHIPSLRTRLRVNECVMAATAAINQCLRKQA